MSDPSIKSVDNTTMEMTLTSSRATMGPPVFRQKRWYCPNCTAGVWPEAT